MLLLLSTIQLAQAQKFNSNLLKSYTQNELTLIENENPKMINVLEYAILNACYYIEKPTNKSVDYPIINTSNDSNNFTDLGLKITDKTQFFISKSSGKLLVVKSLYVIELEMKNKK